MDVRNLIRMANQIGGFFEAMPDRQEAIDGIAQHLHKFWEPRMHAALAQHVAAHGSSELHPLVALAVRSQAPGTASMEAEPSPRKT